MYTDPQIRYDTTLLLDMHARHPHTLVSTLHECCSSMDMVLDDTLTTVMTCTSDTQIYYTDYCYTYMSTGTRRYQFTYYYLSYDSYHHIIITWMLGTQLSHGHTSLLHMLTARVYMHVLFLSFCHMNYYTYYVYYCSILSLYSSDMIVSCYWYWYSRYWTWELLICDMWNATSIVLVSCYIVPVSRYIVQCYQQSSGPVIMLPVSCTVIILVTLYAWHIRL